VSERTTVLFRPVGQEELELIRSTDFKEFPPRLPGQPIFYPVLNEQYARQIAEQWNAKRTVSGRGYVTRFQVITQFLEKISGKTVGSSIHQEHWIPAADLVEFKFARQCSDCEGVWFEALNRLQFLLNGPTE
jgi:hypothetical protein